MPIEHDAITDPDIHEPKGVSSAVADKVYVSDGAGSGSWKYKHELGWALYDDGAGAQVITTTPALYTNDGAGANTSEARLPYSYDLAGTSLWDTTNDVILPENLGDCLMYRINFEVTATSGAPNYILVEVDVSGAGTTIITGRAMSIYKTAPFDLEATNMVVALTGDPVTNGFGLYMSTDTGTATINSKQILITRLIDGSETP